VSVVLVRDTERVRILTMNRPDRLNAFNQELFAGLADAFAEAAADDSVHVVVLTGAGRAFTAGADLTDMGRAPTRAAPGAGEAGGGGEAGGAEGEAAGAARDNPFDRLLQQTEAFPKPLVGAINGVGAGLGFTIVAHCDFAFIARSARLRTPFTQLGLVPEASSSYLFPLRMGWQKAALALIAGEWFDAQATVEAGLALKVCEDDAVLEEATQFAVRLATGPLQSLRGTKELMLRAHRAPIADARQQELAALGRLVGTDANRAALAEFATRQGR
jgi:enoyl-CoA hydratase/carnithine racemase